MLHGKQHKQLQDLLVMDFTTQAIANVMCKWSVAVIEPSLVIRETTMSKWKFYVTLSWPVGVNYTYTDDEHASKMSLLF